MMRIYIKIPFYVVPHKMEVNYNALSMVDLRALARECELRGFYGLRRAGLINLLQNNQDTNYESMRLVKLCSLMKEHNLQGQSGRSKIELIT